MNFRRLGQLRSLDSKKLNSAIIRGYGQVVGTLAKCESLDTTSNAAVCKNRSAQKKNKIVFLKGHVSIIIANIISNIYSSIYKLLAIYKYPCDFFLLIKMYWGDKG